MQRVAFLRNLVLIAVLGAIALLLFHGTIHSFFMGETLDYLGPINMRILLHNLWGDASWMSGHYARSAVRLMWCIEQYVFGLDPAGYHIVNVLFHMANCLLAFLLLKRILGSDRTGLVASAFAAFLFLAHSGAAENVRWITERWDLSMSFFYILALMMFMQYKRRKGRPYLLVLSVVFFWVSLCSKEMAFSFPLIVLLYDFYYLRGFKNIWPFDWRKLLVHLPFWGTAILYFIYRFARHRSVADYRTALGGTQSLMHSIKAYLAWFGYPFGAWGAIVIFLLALVFGGRSLRFLALFVVVALLPAAHIPEVWRGYLPMLGFAMLLGAVLSRNWIQWFSDRWSGEAGAKPVNRDLVFALRLVQVVLFVFIFSTNSFATLRGNAAWDRNASKMGALPVRLKADHPSLAFGTQVYVVNMQAAVNALPIPCFLTPPVAFMYGGQKVEAFPFEQMYRNLAQGELPSPDKLYIYTFKNGSLHEDRRLKRDLLHREALPITGAIALQFPTESTLRIGDGQVDSSKCLVLSGPTNLPDEVNTIVVRMRASPGGTQARLTGEVSWRSKDVASGRITTSGAQFEVVPDGTTRTYRLAVGTFADWVFAENLNSIKLCFRGRQTDVTVASVVGMRERFAETDEKKPTWEGFDAPFHVFAKPRYMRMSREKMNYYMNGE
ncbi:MAG TPA: hypothetical protein VM163_00680 [bacterium]|nr:hypothetical protein [bacterium]